MVEVSVLTNYILKKKGESEKSALAFYIGK